jgi:hypothetical protein
MDDHRTDMTDRNNVSSDLLRAVNATITNQLDVAPTAPDEQSEKSERKAAYFAESRKDGPTSSELE